MLPLRLLLFSLKRTLHKDYKFSKSIYGLIRSSPSSSAHTEEETTQLILHVYRVQAGLLYIDCINKLTIPILFSSLLVIISYLKKK